MLFFLRYLLTRVCFQLFNQKLNSPKLDHISSDKSVAPHPLMRPQRVHHEPQFLSVLCSCHTKLLLIHFDLEQHFDVLIVFEFA